MGKGSRNRQVRTDDKIANPQKYVQKKAAPKHLTSIIAAAVAIFVVVALVVSAVASSGIVLRLQKTVSTEHFKVTGTMMSYYANNAYSNFISEYESLLGSSSSSSNISVYSLLGIDPNKDLDKQIKNKDTKETWFDFFMNQARDQVEETLLYCEGAYAAGIELDEDDYAQIDYSIMMLEAYASFYNLSASSYIKSLYGDGVLEKDVRAAMKLDLLASKFVEKLSDDYYAASTDDAVNKFYADHTNDYLSADYLKYSITSTMGTIKSDATEEEAAKIREEYEADKKAAEELVEKLKAATTPDEFKKVVEDYLNETLAEEYHEKYYDKYLKDAKGETDEEKAENAKKAVADKLKEDIDAKIEGMLVEDMAYSNSSDLGKWIFGADESKNEETGEVTPATDPAKTNDIWVDTDTKYEESKDDKKEEDKDENKVEKSHTVTVYFLVRESSRDDALTYNIAYLALSSANKYTEDDAKKALADFEKTGKTAEDLLKLADNYKSHSGCTEIENARPGYFDMEEIDEWVFNTERKDGDYVMLSAKHDEKTTIYFIVLIEGEGHEVWYADCEDDMVVSQIEDWLENAQKTYPVTFNEWSINNVKL